MYHKVNKMIKMLLLTLECRAMNYDIIQTCWFSTDLLKNMYVFLMLTFYGLMCCQLPTLTTYIGLFSFFWSKAASIDYFLAKLTMWHVKLRYVTGSCTQ